MEFAFNKTSFEIDWEIENVENQLKTLKENRERFKRKFEELEYKIEEDEKAFSNKSRISESRKRFISYVDQCVSEVKNEHRDYVRTQTYDYYFNTLPETKEKPKNWRFPTTRDIRSKTNLFRGSYVAYKKKIYSNQNLPTDKHPEFVKCPEKGGTFLVPAIINRIWVDTHNHRIEYTARIYCLDYRDGQVFLKVEHCELKELEAFQHKEHMIWLYKKQLPNFIDWFKRHTSAKPGSKMFLKAMAEFNSLK